MPVVPRRGPSYVQTTPRPSLQPAGAFNPPTPVDIGPAIQGLGKIVEEHAQHADQVALLEADNQLNAVSTNLEVQTLQRKGKDALNAGADVQEQWTKATSNIESSLTNDRQREAFRTRADHHWQSLDRTVQMHGASEFQKYDTENTDAALVNRLDSAVKNYTDPTILGQSLAESKDLIDLYGQRNGWSPEQVAAKKTDVVSKIHTGVIDHMLTDHNDLMASKYFTAHKDELNAQDTLQVGKALEVGSRRGESQRQGDRILKETTNLTDAVAQARLIEDPEVRDLTESRLRNDYSEKAQALRDQREQAMQGATNIIERTHDFNSIPPSSIASMSVGERESLRNYAEKLAGGGAVKTNLTRYYALVQMASTPETRDKFLQLDLNQEKPNLSASDFEEMVKLQSSVRKGEDKPLKQLYTNQQIISGVINQAMIGVDRKGKVKDKGLIAQFRDAVRQETDQFEANNGRLPTGEETKKIANELATRHVVERPGWLWGTNKEDIRTFQIVPGEEPLIQSIKDVPPQDRAQIRNALQNRGRAVTDQAIIEAYRAHIKTLVPEP